MKILFLINSLVGGGAERVLVNLSDEFIKQDHEVGVFVKEKTIAYQINPLLKIFHIQDKNENLPSVLRLVCNYFKRFRYLRRVINDMKPDVIIASWGSNLSHVLLAHKDIPIVASEHNTFDRKHSIHEKLNRFYLNRFFDKVAVLTRYDKAYMANILKNTIVIPNPLSFSPLSAEEYEKTFEARRHILACGRLNAYHVKGFDSLIRCYSQVAALHPEWDLDIAGTGDNQSMQDLRELTQKYGIEKRVHFIGFQTDIASVMKRHSIFVLSSRSEGFGMVVAEAMAMGCACVCYDLSGPSEIVIDTIDGLLVESQNEVELIDAIESLIVDEEKRWRLGMHAIYNVRRFDPNMITDKWYALFRSLQKK